MGGEIHLTVLLWGKSARILLQAANGISLTSFQTNSDVCILFLCPFKQSLSVLVTGAASGMGTVYINNGDLYNFGEYFMNNILSGYRE